jgi:hypothetical protein
MLYQQALVNRRAHALADSSKLYPALGPKWTSNGLHDPVKVG